MPRVELTSHLQRHLQVKPGSYPGRTLAQVLNHLFEANPGLRSYLLDDQGHIRQHVAVFIDDILLQDRNNLNISVSKQTTIHIVQALSGG